MGYTASDAISRIKLKSWTSTSSALTDAQLLELLNDALRSDVMPFLKSVRDEWFVSGSESVTPDANGRITLPNSVASTIRTIWWNNNGNYVPLARIEPEASPAYLGNGGGAQPFGYVLKGYEIQILPANVGSATVRIDFMERPAEMVLAEDAAEVLPGLGLALTLASVPVAWQEEAPESVEIINGDSPFYSFGEYEVVSLVGDQLALADYPVAPQVLPVANAWVTDPGTNPFPNIPIELHPLLQQNVIVTLFSGLGDKRLKDAQAKLMKFESDLRKLMSPRTQGSARPILNPNAPGMRAGRGSRGWY